jgi:ditrans,polycis-polyprenyl diphosphate synthase
MYTGDCPPVDVLVRTSGEVRLSDYLLWQVSENCLVHFVPELWPELSIRQLLWFILDYQSKYTMLQVSCHTLIWLNRMNNDVS